MGYLCLSLWSESIHKQIQVLFKIVKGEDWNLCMRNMCILELYQP